MESRDGGNIAVRGLGIKMMVGNVEIMVSALNNSSALNLTPGHIIPGRPRAPCCQDASSCWTPAEPGRARNFITNQRFVSIQSHKLIPKQTQKSLIKEDVWGAEGGEGRGEAVMRNSPTGRRWTRPEMQSATDRATTRGAARRRRRLNRRRTAGNLFRSHLDHNWESRWCKGPSDSCEVCVACT